MPRQAGEGRTVTHTGRTGAGLLGSRGMPSITVCVDPSSRLMHAYAYLHSCMRTSIRVCNHMRQQGGDTHTGMEGGGRQAKARRTGRLHTARTISRASRAFQGPGGWVSVTPLLPHHVPGRTRVGRHPMLLCPYYCYPPPRPSLVRYVRIPSRQERSLKPQPPAGKTQIGGCPHSPYM